MMGSGSQSLWNMNSTQPYCRVSSTSTSTSSSSSSLHQNDQNTSSFQTPTAWHASHELPESWSQLLLGSLQEEEDRCSFTAFPSKGILDQNGEEQQISYQSPANIHSIVDLNHHELLSWGSIVSPSSSPGSCSTTSLISSSCSSMFDFSICNSERKSLQQDQSVEYNSTSTTGSALKKAKVQLCSALPTLKVRKEKVGDRVTALHQLVSPFGKTDTASVLLEAIGYIRFLQSQILALSSPYLGKRQSNEAEQSVDLRSRGLCLVPVSSTLNFGGNISADYWAASFGVDFR